MAGSSFTRNWNEKGIPIVDATEPLKVCVRKCDIKGAGVKNPGDCAMARACKRQKGVKSAHFTRSTAYLEFDDKVVKYDLPTSIQKEIVAFDRAGDKAFEPGVYQLSKVRPSATQAVQKAKANRRRKLIREGKIVPNRQKQNHNGKAFRHVTANVRRAK